MDRSVISERVLDVIFIVFLILLELLELDYHANDSKDKYERKVQIKPVRYVLNLAGLQFSDEVKFVGIASSIQRESTYQ